MSMRTLLPLTFAAMFACACGGSTTQQSHPGEDAGSSDTGSMVVVDSSPGGDSSAPIPEAGPGGTESVQTSIGPIPVAGGQEETVCITKRLTNPDPLVITDIQIALAQGSHHLIVYSVTDTQENLTPTPCTP